MYDEVGYAQSRTPVQLVQECFSGTPGNLLPVAGVSRQIHQIGTVCKYHLHAGVLPGGLVKAVNLSPAKWRNIPLSLISRENLNGRAADRIAPLKGTMHAACGGHVASQERPPCSASHFMDFNRVFDSSRKILSGYSFTSLL